ncbi:MAG: LemA family protein [Gammaproteobacteria bacterium]|nr:LemA family protein [Gammaproteobacteria bacterium]MBU0828116.1 LemA family protein [Gammaproteobacteria bacterium]MBU0891926.1 LemA family protein [Gammaproteobacteria bacterium]MBU1354613.1 LemA family protein [Gammaproteobacteria bacterium]MBU1507293.1 LemA family protein [Gammaproteobacteria bacterium]
MWSSPLFWMVFAIVVFWALGAYNRLIRLRSAVAQAFGGFDAHLVRLVALLGEFNAAQATQRATLLDGNDQTMAALQGATTQLSACLAVARARPMAVDAVAALAASRDVLHAAWHAATRQTRDEPYDGSQDTSEFTNTDPAVRTPSIWDVRWDEHALQNEQAARVLNDAVAYYNAAIAQFPANLLAWVFGFKAARGL